MPFGHCKVGKHVWTGLNRWPRGLEKLALDPEKSGRLTWLDQVKPGQAACMHISQATFVSSSGSADGMTKLQAPQQGGTMNGNKLLPPMHVIKPML